MIIVSEYDPLNRMTTAIDWAGNTTFAYSKRSELVGKTDPGLLSQGYVFDSVSNKIVMIDPDNGFCTYSFDAVNGQVGLVDRYGGVSTAAFPCGPCGCPPRGCFYTPACQLRCS